MNMNMTAADVRNMAEAQNMFSQNLIDAVRRYFAKNADMILAGLFAMNGSVYVPADRK